MNDVDDDDDDDVNRFTGNVSFQTLMSDLEKAHGENVNFYFPNNVFPQEEKVENSKYVFLPRDNKRKNVKLIQPHSPSLLLRQG